VNEKLFDDVEGMYLMLLVRRTGYHKHDKLMKGPDRKMLCKSYIFILGYTWGVVQKDVITKISGIPQPQSF
jgi:hypothetical protein